MLGGVFFKDHVQYLLLDYTNEMLHFFLSVLGMNWSLRLLFVYSSSGIA